jgi:tetratricopeptide (TPR) repeat protein
MLSKCCLAVCTIAVMSLPQCSWENVPTRVEKSTVLITHKSKEGKQEHGTGFFIQRPKQVCTVLTASHVTAKGKTVNLSKGSDGDSLTLETTIDLNIQTSDGKNWKAANIQTISNMDIAIVTFDAGLHCPYPSLKLDESDKVKVGDTISIGGFPLRETQKGNNSELLFQFVSGKVSAIPPYPLSQGYGISYEATTAGGMSGGPVVNSNGKVVAIHGVTDREVARLTEINDTQFQSAEQEEAVNKAQNRLSLGIPTFKWGIPIKYYLQNISSTTISLTPAQPEAHEWISYGYLMLLFGDSKNAVLFFEKATQLDPKSVDAWYGKGLALSKNNENQKSIICFDKVLEIQPNHYQSLTKKGYELASFNKLNDAFENFDKALKIKKDYGEALFGKAAIYYRQNKLEESISFSNQAINADRKNDYFWYFKGLVLEKAENYKEALIAFDKAISINDRQSDYWTERGMALGNLEQYNQALESANKALSINSANEKAWLLKSLALLNLEKYEDAYKSVENVLRINPNNSDAKDIKKFVLIELGK